MGKAQSCSKQNFNNDSKGDRSGRHSSLYLLLGRLH